MKYTVAHYLGIGESPMVILLGVPKGLFKRQFNTIEELKLDIGDNPIYFVADYNTNERFDLNNWHGGDFDFNKLKTIIDGF